MKKAKINIQSVFAQCPECDEDIFNKEGSFLIQVTEYEPDHKFECGNPICSWKGQLEMKAFTQLHKKSTYLSIPK